ncbi:hypothetical protein NBRC110019_05730 [Neptunitalea chrysea]|uniref:Uncharacterized protein n=1 Tax=Neptunitalea chrysea TaxID=1647581 RepID=A0A9W6B354_9FLAO|nr:hypothetical protein NBRC110019_05730 [Neptunitalea chrysea]
MRINNGSIYQVILLLIETILVFDIALIRFEVAFAICDDKKPSCQAYTKNKLSLKDPFTRYDVDKTHNFSISF